MKMTDGQKSFIIIIVGVLIGVLSFVYVMKPNFDSIQSLGNECIQLQAKLDDLQRKQNDRDSYLEWTEKYEAAFDLILSSFPADLNQEVTIMFLEGVKDDNDFDIGSLTMGAKEPFYTLGSGGSTAQLNTGAAAGGTATTEAAADTTTETATTEAATTPVTVDTASGDYVCYRAAFPISYEGSYESLKDVLKYVNTFVNRMAIDSIDITYSPENDEYSGNLNMMCYSIEGPDRPESNMQLNDIETGIENIFTGGATGSNSAASKMTKYDENDGAAIENSYDFYAMLNPASSDVSAKVIGQNGSGKEASVISNSDNEVSSLSYDFYEVDGKNYCKYTIAGDTSYEAEITSAEDVKVLLQSSARKDSDDKAGVRVTIRNTTSLPVYVKVTGDDAVTPRVQIVSKSGAVKVYK